MSLYVAGQFPIYTPETNNYKNDVVYNVEIEEQEKGEYCVTQTVTGESSFLYQVLKNKEAEFGITYKIQDSIVRRTQKYPLAEESNGKIVGQYTIKDVPKGTIFTLLPFILLLEEKEIQVSENKAYGLNEIWWGDSLSFHKYSKIAHFPPFKVRDDDSMISPFTGRLDKNLKKGELWVEFMAYETAPFIVSCAEDVFYFLRRQGDNELKTAIENQILVSSFAEIRQHYQKHGDYGSSELLDVLKENMEEQGLESWTEDGFNASYAAMKLNPFKIPK